MPAELLSLTRDKFCCESGKTFVQVRCNSKMSNQDVQLIALVKIIVPGESEVTNKLHEIKMLSTGDTVEELKIQIESEFGYKASHQQLRYNGDIMDNEEALLHYDMQNNTFNYVEIFLYMLDELPEPFA